MQVPPEVAEVVEHRVAGEAVLRDEPLDVERRRGAGDRDQPGQRHADVGGVLVAELQRSTEPFVVLSLDQTLVARLVEDVRDLLGRERRGDLVLGFDTEEPDARLGQPVHRVDDRRQHPGDHHQGGYQRHGGRSGRAMEMFLGIIPP